MQSELADSALLDRITDRMSRALAARVPRRTFLGKVGRYTAAAAVGGTASTLLWQDSALAACGTPPCGYSSSVSCQCLFGSPSGACPSNTCECGCWVECNHTRCASPHWTQWCDCCWTSTPNRCDCIGSCSCRPNNCFTKEWGGGCGTINVTVIRCRTFSCVNGATGC